MNRVSAHYFGTDGDSQQFVHTNGTSFKLGDKPFHFQGTNFFYIGSVSDRSESDVYEALRQLAVKGIKVVRFWGFSCQGAMAGGVPIIESVHGGKITYNEKALRRLDIALDAARDAGLKVILTMVNFEPEVCGMQWWVKQLTGDDDKHRFYFDAYVKSVFKDYVGTILTRVNSRYRETLGYELSYRDDPTIMSIELANEPHTEDYYEINRNKRPGDLTYWWLVEMAAFVRSVDKKHLISTGEEGYKTSHSWGDHGYRHAWIHDGMKGVDFERNVSIPNISFATVHIYPDNWNIPSQDMWWVKDYLVRDRANIAHAAGKPIIMEETGFARGSRFARLGYSNSTDYWLNQITEFANAASYAGTLVWQLVPPGYSKGDYEFDFNDQIFWVVAKQIQFMNNKN
jgi:mannan endo-1,4-beta-mannosidase